MSVYKDTKSNTWKVYYRFTDWQGKVHQSTKRGFPTKREALAWEREQLHKVEADLDMTFESFIDTYTADMRNRLKENTWHTKEHIIRTKLLPYFAKRKMNSIVNLFIGCKRSGGGGDPCRHFLFSQKRSNHLRFYLHTAETSYNYP